MMGVRRRLDECLSGERAYPSLSREPSPSADSTEGAPDVNPRARGLGDVFLLLELEPLLEPPLPPLPLDGPVAVPLMLEPILVDSKRARVLEALRSVPLESFAPSSPARPSLLLKLLLCLTRWRNVLGITSSDR